MIKLQELSKDYFIDKKPYRALHEVSLDFPSVQFVSILGPSGCGKSTLLNLIGGLDGITEGDILVDGKSLKSMSEKDLDSYRNNDVGFIFQDYYLIPHLSILDNIKIALAVRDYSESDMNEKSLQALASVGLQDMAKKKPNQLSGGQAQRVAIARALVTDPKVILADEPTGALDSETAKEIMTILKDLSKSKLVLMVTHNEELARDYSDRIIRLKDGKVESDSLVSEPVEMNEERPLRRSRLSLKMKLKLAFQNIWSKKGKTILTSVANSFGMVGIAFFLAINNGYQHYSSNLSSASASSLPVIVSAYSQNTTSDSYGDHNASVLYPESDEIYPVVSLSSQSSYRYNNFTTKYLNFLDSLEQEKIIKNYVKSYGNSYGYNLATDFPKSINEQNEGGYDYVYTNYTSYNYYAYSSSLPYNIFHILYGDMTQYDCIAGSLPANKNEIVLVVNQYNGVNFGILRALGFYNSSDTQKDVEDSESTTKVKPISFQDVIGKTYKVFNNDEVYELKNDDYLGDTKDLIGNDTQVTTYSRKSLDEEFVSSHGTELKISGILRPKKESPFSLLSPSLCYSQELQDELMPINANSQVAQTIKRNLVLESSKTNAVFQLMNDLKKLENDYQSSESSVFSTSELNDVMSQYFWYYPVIQSGYKYSGFNTFLNDAKTIGADLIPERLLGVDISNADILQREIDSLEEKLNNSDPSFYDDVIGLVAYINAYSSLDYIVIFPTSLETRTVLLERLRAFNNIEENSPDHASSQDQVVTFAEENDNFFLTDVSQMISLVSIILIAFAIIALLVSSLMTMSSISNSVLERKQEIGLLRSLGSRKSDVAWLFEIESFFIGLFAGVVGSLLTFIFSFPLNNLINANYPDYHVGQICNLTWWHVLVVISMSVVISMISALLPSLKASRQKPADTLRSE